MKKLPVALSLFAAATLALTACDNPKEDEPVAPLPTVETSTSPVPDDEIVPEPSVSVSVSPSPSKSVSVKPSLSVSPSPIKSPDSEGDGPNT